MSGEEKVKRGSFSRSDRDMIMRPEVNASLEIPNYCQKITPGNHGIIVPSNSSKQKIIGGCLIDFRPGLPDYYSVARSGIPRTEEK